MQDAAVLTCDDSKAIDPSRVRLSAMPSLISIFLNCKFAWAASSLAFATSPFAIRIYARQKSTTEIQYLFPSVSNISREATAAVSASASLIDLS